MSRLPELADRVERLLLRYDEQKRANALLEQQVRTITDERDKLRSRLAAARARIEALIDRLPASDDEPTCAVALAEATKAPSSAPLASVHANEGAQT